MSYQFGQFRKTQADSYLTALGYELSSIEVESKVTQGVRFVDKAITLNNGKVFQSTDDTGTKQKCYYLRLKFYRMLSSQKITISLVNTSKTEDNTQIIETFEIDEGLETDSLIKDFVIAPNTTYDQIRISLERSASDYDIINEDGTYGRIISVQGKRVDEIINVIDNYISGIKKLKQIGVQGRPGLQMCIDGESIKIGRTGIYEINHEISIKFLGFIITPDENNYFILDYQY